jgi:hypothetical protein
MRTSMIAGLALIVIGGFVLVRGGSFSSRRDMMKVGDMTISAVERRPIEPWIAGLAVIGGIALVAAGARRKA